MSHDIAQLVIAGYVGMVLLRLYKLPAGIRKCKAQFTGQSQREAAFLAQHQYKGNNHGSDGR